VLVVWQQELGCNDGRHWWRGEERYEMEENGNGR